MTNNEFDELMTQLVQQPDWPEVYKQIRAELEANDPCLNALLDQFVQVSPRTQGESRMILYLLLASMRIFVLARAGRLQSYTVKDAIGISNRGFALK